MTEVLPKPGITEEDIEIIAKKAEISARKLARERAERGNFQFNQSGHGGKTSPDFKNSSRKLFHIDSD